MTMTRQTRSLIATICLILAGLAGVVTGQIRDQIRVAHDARELFYLTNPDGPAGDYAAAIAADAALCASQAAALGACAGSGSGSVADAWVETALRE